MTNRKSLPLALWTVSAGSALLVAGCAGSDSSDSTAEGGFQLTSISVPVGATPPVWEVNRPIQFEFNLPVDFSSVNPNSISIRQSDLCDDSPPDDSAPSSTVPFSPVNGTFHLISPNVVEWRPVCPKSDDFASAGLSSPNVFYEIFVGGKLGGNGINVLSMESEVALQKSQTRCFVTPNSTSAVDLFLDTIPDAVAPAKDGSGEDLTSLEIGGASGAVEMPFSSLNDVLTERFVPDGLGGLVLETSAGSDGIMDGAQDINLYSAPDSRVAVLLELNQPVNPAAENINSDRVRLEARPITVPPTNTWTRLPTNVELTANCTEAGASLRLEPQGILPQRSEIRVVVTSQFQDLVEQTNLLDLDDSFVFRTREYDFTADLGSTQMADELNEGFVLAGNEFGSLEDTLAPFAEPRAKWNGGALEAAFDFQGDGGTDGEFDYYVAPNETVTFDTNIKEVFGGPNALPPAQSDSVSQTAVNGVLNVRNLLIDGPSEANPGAAPGILAATGSNPLIIQATGDVIIRGYIDVSGIPAKDVATLNTANQVEVGAAGIAGGGKGGDASFLTNTSTPTGGNGFGAFNTSNLGGRGGESGFGQGNKSNRRPGGGGGGAFGPDDPNFDSSLAFGYMAQDGFNGSTTATGSLSKKKPPKGGDFGPRPFLDGNDDNDFWGTQRLVNPDDTVTIVQGELANPLAGSGGGAGGDAVQAGTFPHPNWAPGTDEKGGGGGGGGGQIQILALGDIIFELEGQVFANGGQGATGENTIGTDRVGGGGGGGSGGHVILQTPRTVDFSTSTVTPKAIVARGGRGAKGAGSPGFGGTNAGGDGGPGIVQIHVLDPEDDILLPDGKAIPGLTDPSPRVLVPTFGGVSKARSRWIAMGGATYDPFAPDTPENLHFLFDGIVSADGDPEEGQVLSTDGTVDDISDPVLEGLAVTDISGGGSGYDVRLDVSAVKGTIDDLYLRNPQLLVDFAVDINDGIPASRYDIVGARINPASASPFAELDLMLDPPLSTTILPGTDADVVPRFFRVATSGDLDSLPDSTFIKLEFQATSADANGQPNEESFLVDWTSDIEEFNSQPESPAFFRFRVEFNISADGSPLSGSSPRPQLRFVRFPILF